MPTGGKRAGAGRPPGAVNKLASARIERLVEQGKRLPPEDLLLLAELYAGMAARYQPTNTNPDTGEKKPNRNHNEERYAFWLGRWGDALAKAAPYYAPRLMAVQNQVQIEDKRARVDPREVMLEIYLEMLRRGELTAKVLVEPAAISEVAYKIVRADLQAARELYRILVAGGGDAACRFVRELAAGLENEKKTTEQPADVIEPDCDGELVWRSSES